MTLDEEMEQAKRELLNASRHLYRHLPGIQISAPGNDAAKNALNKWFAAVEYYNICRGDMMLKDAGYCDTKPT